MTQRKIPLKRYGSLLISAYFLTFAFAVSFYAHRKPFHNWDMIAYVASINHFKGFRGDSLSKATYGDVRNSVSASQFQFLTHGYYRSTVYESPKALSEQLPFYEIKPLYLMVCWFVSCFTNSISNATVLVSAFFGGIFILISSFFLKKRSGSISVILPPLLLSIGVLQMSQLSTPDIFAATMGLIGVSAAENRPKLSLVLLAILPAIRPDYIILDFLISAIIYFFESIRIFTILSFFCSLALYLAIKKYFHGYSYPLLFNFSFIPSPQPYPHSMHISENVLQYFEVYWHAKAIYSKIFFSFGFLSFGILAYRALHRLSGYHEVISLAVLLYSILHFILFPELSTRFYFFSVAIGLISVLRIVSDIKPPPDTILTDQCLTRNHAGVA